MGKFKLLSPELKIHTHGTNTTGTTYLQLVIERVLADSKKETIAVESLTNPLYFSYPRVDHIKLIESFYEH